MAQRRCHACDGVVREAAVFCSACGARVEPGTLPPVPETSPPTPGTLPPVPSMSSEQQEAATKQRVLAPPTSGVGSEPPMAPPPASAASASPRVSRPTWVKVVLAGTAIAIAVVLGVVGALVLGSDDSGEVASERSNSVTVRDGSSTDADDGSDASASPPSPTVLPVTTTSTTTTTTTTTTPPDPEVVAFEAIQDWEDESQQRVSDTILDRWAPQLSSKRLGLYDPATDITWDSYELILEHFRELEDRHGDVLVLDSNEYATFTTPDLWVVMVNQSFADSSDVIDWCRDQGLGRNDCLAKRVSRTGPAEGSTVYQPS